MTSQRHCTQEELTLLHYRALSPEDHQRVIHHLESCVHCQHQLETLNDDLNAVIDSPLNLSAKERQQFTDRVMQKRSPRRWYWPTFGATLAATAALLIVLVWQPMGPTLPVEPQSATSVAVDSTLVEEAPDALMASFETVEQIEMIDQIELLKNLELLQTMDLLHDLSSST